MSIAQKMEELSKCRLCPRNCGVDRASGETGFCRAGSEAEVYAAHLHYGEEPPISGTRGSGTIFFNHCNMRCVYCQNFRLSQIENGKACGTKELAGHMVRLAESGAHNINLVTPTHYAIQIKGALGEARSRGCDLPIVYNSGGYESVETLDMLKGYIDIYLVDMRYGDNKIASKYSDCPDYVEINQKAVARMFEQVGHLKLSAEGIAEKGVIVRHLILPNRLAGTDSVFSFLDEALGKDVYVSLMSQYYPVYRAGEFKELSRVINAEEYREAHGLLEKHGFSRGWIQEFRRGPIDDDFAGSKIARDV